MSFRVRRGQAGKDGAGERIRTVDPQLGKLVLYQLSYARSGKDFKQHQSKKALL